jgi:hypothetical protein
MLQRLYKDYGCVMGPQCRSLYVHAVNAVDAVMHVCFTLAVHYKNLIMQ